MADWVAGEDSAECSDVIHKCVQGWIGLQVKTLLNPVSALPQLEQAVKLQARVPQAKWAADLHTIASTSSAPATAGSTPLRTCAHALHAVKIRDASRDA